MEDAVDLLILGSGSTAFAAALTAQELKKTALMTEERPVGGTCVNRGCLPSKNLIAAAKLLYDAQHPRFAGLTPCTIGLDFAALIAQKDELVHTYRKQKYESLIDGEIRLETGHVQFIDPHTVDVGGKRLKGRKLLIATGSRPSVPNIEGLETLLYLTSDLLTVDESIELRERPSSLLIIGGGYIALELGQMFSRFGTTVTILERSRQLLAHGYEPEVGRTISEIFSEEGIQVVLNAEVRAVRQDRREVVTTAFVAGRERQYRTERLLVATGRRPNSDHIGIERSGVQVNQRGEVVVDAICRPPFPTSSLPAMLSGYSTAVSSPRQWAAVKVGWRHGMRSRTNRLRL